MAQNLGEIVPGAWRIGQAEADLLGRVDDIDGAHRHIGIGRGMNHAVEIGNLLVRYGRLRRQRAFCDPDPVRRANRWLDPTRRRYDAMRGRPVAVATMTASTKLRSPSIVATLTCRSVSMRA